MRTLPRTHGVGGQITRVTIAGCNRLQSTDAIRGAFHAPSELETLLDWIKGKVLQGQQRKNESSQGRTESRLRHGGPPQEGLSPRPLKLAQLRAAGRIWLNGGVLRNFACLMGVLLHFCGDSLSNFAGCTAVINFGTKFSGRH